MPPAADYCAVCGEHLLGKETPANEDEIQEFVAETLPGTDKWIPVE